MNFAPASMHAYIGAVLEADLDTESTMIMTVIRYHADENGVVYLTKPEIAAAAKLGRTTAFQRLADLAARQFVRTLKANNRGSVYQLATIEEIRSAVRAADGIVRQTDGAVRQTDGIVRAANGSVRAADGMSSPGERQDHIGIHSGSDLTAELHNKAAAAAADAQAPTHTHEAMPLPVETAGTPELAELVAAWWATQLGQGGRRPGFIVPPAILGAIKALLDKHGAERLRWAIGAAVEKTNQGAPSIAFLTRLCEGGPLPERARPTAPGGYQGAAYKSVNGVAEPREVPEGKW